MYSYFSDLHVDLMARALLLPGERRVAQTVVQHIPLWALGWINKTFLVIATDQRLILVEHRMSWIHLASKVHEVRSIPWASLQQARVGGLFVKKLALRGRGSTGPFR